MAEDTRLRDQLFTQPKPAEGSRARRGPDDPLAELARLIGQEDPFADFAGGAKPRATRAPAAAAEAKPSQPAPRYNSFDRPHPLRPREPERDRDAGRADARAYEYAPSKPRTESERSARSESAYTPPGRSRTDDRYARTRAEERDVYEDERTDAYDPKYSEDAYLPEHGDEVYEDAHPRRRGVVLFTIAAVVGLVIVGTAGVFGYRAIFGPTMGKSPPVIGPQAGPTKVAPPAATTQPEGTKQIYDRVGAPAPERVMPGPETPIDVAARTGRPPAAAPVPAAPTPTPTQPDPAPVASAPVPAAAPPASTGPRRVRTVTVRADGTIVNEPTPTPATAPARPVPVPRAAPAPPLAVNTYAPTAPASDDPEPTTRSRAAAIPAPPPAPSSAPPAPATAQRVPPPPTSGPVWPPLQPQTAARPSGPVSQQVRVQTQAPAIQTQPPASGYVVQVSSQRSEAEAQAAWRAMQARYSSVLGGHNATIRRADLGERGTFYRAQVGPFGSRNEADRLCQNLKAAGGECIVQRN
jgi:hypothetical protein